MSAKSPTNCRYTREHEWARQDANEVLVGITDYAQHALGDVVYVDLPAVGTEVTAGKSFATVESVKAVSDIYAPVDGRITKVNDALGNSPELVNSDPFNGAWMIAIAPNKPEQFEKLLSSTDYDAFVGEIAK